MFLTRNKHVGVFSINLENNGSNPEKEGVIFTFSTKELTSTDKVKFHYALKGRNGNPGLLEKSNGDYLAPSVILIENNHEDSITSFFNKWNISFEKFGVIKEDVKEFLDSNINAEKGGGK